MDNNEIVINNKKNNNIIQITNNNVRYYETQAEIHANNAQKSAGDCSNYVAEAKRILSDCENIKNSVETTVDVEWDNLTTLIQNHITETAETISEYESSLVSDNQEILGESIERLTDAMDEKLEDMVTESELASKGYLTQHQSLSNYYDKQNIDTKLSNIILIPVTYSDLVALKAAGELKEGAFYRITDYVTTTNGKSANAELGAKAVGTVSAGAEPSRSAGHQFDVIIQALGASDLADIGTCALHEGDTYFANSNLGAWQIWYDIENNTDKYDWADTENGKGVIYRMIDEYLNDLPYDFKNIQFYRDKSLSKYSTVAANLLSSDGYYYTFTYFNNASDSTAKDSSISSAANYDCRSNVFGIYATNSSYDIKPKTLNNTIIVAVNTSYVALNLNNYFEEPYNNTLSGDIYSNKTGIYFESNVINGRFFYNNIGNVFSGNTITSSEFSYNTIGHSFVNNTILGQFKTSTIGQSFTNNKIGTLETSQFSQNTIGSGFARNTIGNNFQMNTVWANNVYHNIGDTFTRNVIEPSCLYFTVGNSVQANHFGEWTAAIIVPDNMSRLTVDPRCSGSSTTNKLDLTGIPTNLAIPITVTKDVNNQVLAMWQDNGTITGLKKASITATSWTDLVPGYSWES